MASDENGLHIMTEAELAEQQAHYDRELAERPDDGHEILPEVLEAAKKAEAKPAPKAAPKAAK